MKKNLSSVFSPSDLTEFDEIHEVDEDNSQEQYRDASISVTYETSSSDSLETVTCSSNQDLKPSENASLL